MEDALTNYIKYSNRVLAEKLRDLSKMIDRDGITKDVKTETRLLAQDLQYIIAAWHIKNCYM